MSHDTKIPIFLKDYLCIYNSGSVMCGQEVKIHIYISNQDYNKIRHTPNNNFFLNIWSLAVKYMGISYNPRWDPDDAVGDRDPEFVLAQPKDDKLFFLEGEYDVKVYHYDPDTEQLGQCILPGSAFMFVYMMPMRIITFTFFFQLFTNHIESVRKDLLPKDYLYFEPAAKLNRKAIRSFTKAVKELYPDALIEFFVQKCSISARDDFGFLEDAELDGYLNLGAEQK
ncbi:MAG: hypothetical protein R2792_06665 [Saprospiraceae bacterium]